MEARSSPAPTAQFRGLEPIFVLRFVLTATCAPVQLPESLWGWGRLPKGLPHNLLMQ